MSSKYRYWWLSFCDPQRPYKDSFLGACIVEVEAELNNAAFALGVARARGCNPGGESTVLRLPPDTVIDAANLYRLFGCDEAKAMCRMLEERQRRELRLWRRRSLRFQRQSRRPT